MKTIKINYETLIKNDLTFTDYCRYLVEADIADGFRLEAYRGDTLCLFTENIKEAASVESQGCEWIKYRGRRAAEAHTCGKLDCMLPDYQTTPKITVRPS